MDLCQIAKCTGGTLYGDGGRPVLSVKTDSRLVTNGCLFAAIKGERVDGFDFIKKLDKDFDNIAFLCTKKPQNTKNPAVVVTDVIKALGDIARLYLGGLELVKIAVTGSVGKTTTKDFIASALSACLKVHSLSGNRNNELGLPLTALEANKNHKAAVFEMGMRGLGQIAYLCSIVNPDIGVITNIGLSHIELLGTKQNILNAKLELSTALKDRPLILNGDDSLLFGARDRVQNPIFYSVDNPDCQFRAVNISDENGICFDIQHKGKLYPVKLKVPGRHNILNALAAFAVGRTLGLEAQKLIKGIESFKGDGVRQNITQLNGITIIDDCYNASPDSVKAALSVIKPMPGRKTFVLGDMLELGSCAEAEHKKIAKLALEAGVNRLVCIGPLAKLAAKESGGQIECITFEKADMALGWLLKNTKNGDKILFKGSHAVGLDNLVKAFKKGENKQ